MIPSIDTYLHKEIESKLKIILSNRYIIEELLKEIQPNIAQNFINAYSGNSTREIPVIYTMPQDKQTQQGAIYIGLREGEESDPSIGNIEETYAFKEGGLHKDKAYIIEPPTKDRLYFETTNPIGELINVENFQFSRSDNVTIEGNRIYFKYDPELVDLGPFTINYTETKDDEVGLKKGFTSTEHYSILAVSTNMDTVRCLDILIKSILILMRDNPEEQKQLLLQNVKFGQIQEVEIGENTNGTPELLYGRETIVTYKTSYSLDSPLTKMLKEIKVKVSQDQRGE